MWRFKNNSDTSYTHFNSTEQLKIYSDLYNEEKEQYKKINNYIRFFIKKIYEEKYLSKFHIFKKNKSKFSQYICRSYNPSVGSPFYWSILGKLNVEEEIKEFFCSTSYKVRHMNDDELFIQINNAICNNNPMSMSTNDVNTLNEVQESVEFNKKLIEYIEGFMKGKGYDF